MNYIASNLRFLRNLKGLTQAQLAKKLGLNRGNIASYEKKNAEPNVERLQLFARFFEIDVGSFIEIDLSLNLSKIQEGATYCVDEKIDKEETLKPAIKDNGGLLEKLLLNNDLNRESMLFIQENLSWTAKELIANSSETNKTLKELVKLTNKLVQKNSNNTNGNKKDTNRDLQVKTDQW